MRATPFVIAPALVTLAVGSLAAQGAGDSADSPDLPLKPERYLSLDTDEGTWISLDVSPDGETVVFDLLGDLYTVPFAGGDATALTEGMAYDAQPRYSPNGSQVVFVSDRDGAENLWRIDVETKATRQVTDTSVHNYESPDWLPDGDYVVAAIGAGALAGGDLRNPKLWMWHVDGGTGGQLIDEPESRRITGPAPAPDGRHVWFAQRERLWQYNAILPQYQLGVYDRETGEQYARTSRYGSAFRPTISPDGAWLVYGTRHEDRTGLRLRELATGDERWLAYPVQRDDQESVAGGDVLPGMSFTPDSSEVVVSYGGRIWRVPIAPGAEPIPVPFRVRTDLAIGPELAFKYPVDDSPRFAVRQIRDAVPSPDGGALTFAALDRLYVRPLPDGEPRRLTDLDVVEAQPAWSPDGEWIAFVTWSPDGGHLYKVRADGGAPPVRLSTRPAIFQNPAWSADGERLAAIQGPARSFRESARQVAPGAAANVVSIPAAGGDWTLVAPTDGRAFPHTATAAPDRIYLYHRADGLVSIRWDGTDERAHVKVTGGAPPAGGEAAPASLVLMAPSGDRALAQVNNDLYALAVPYAGGETPVVSVANPSGAIVPVRKLTEVGGQFPAWSADGRRAHWSIGNAHFVYDLDAARAAEEAARTAAAAEEEEEEEEGAESEAAAEEGEEGDTAVDDVGAEGPGAGGAEREAADDETGQADDAADAAGAAGEDAPAYEPVEIRVRVEATRDIPDGYGVLRGGRVVTMRGDEVIENADVVVRGNRIVAVGARGAVELDDAVRILDVRGTTIVPGFVDTHAHMRPSFGVHKTQPWTYLANLAYGVTTTRDPQTGTTDVLTYGDLVETGDIVGPRIYSTGPGVFNAEQIADLDHARHVLTRYSEYYDTQTIKMYMSGNRQQRQWILMAAKEQELLPTTEAGLDMKYDLEMIIDGYPGLEHSFPIFPLYRDVVSLAARTRIAYTPTLLVSFGGPFGENWFFTRENPHDDPKLRRFIPHAEIDRVTRRRGAGVDPGPGGWFREEEYVFRQHAEGVKALVEAGGIAGVGSHGQLQGLGYHWELWATQSGGLSEHEALRVATALGAEAIGLDGDLGSIAPGKLADLVVLDANPLDDIRNSNRIRYVMKNGRLYDAETLDETWPRARPLGKPTWLGDEPDGVAAGIRQESAP
ncbi:MAG: amidohydrolase family protein [Acidobacteria bacterium]|nr:amidohydrolase family protein [Acidobacteriota bacterium]